MDPTVNPAYFTPAGQPYAEQITVDGAASLAMKQLIELQTISTLLGMLLQLPGDDLQIIRSDCLDSLTQ